MIAVGIDVGQGGVRGVTDAGAVTTDPRGFWDGPIPDLVVDTVARLVAPDTGRVVVGVGLTGPTDISAAIAAALRSAGYRGELRLASDAVTAHLGAHEAREGVVVAGGTGVVVLGRGPRGSVIVDGLGHELGDRGSGYWIGRECIRAALALAEAESHDPLVSAVVGRWGGLEGFAARWRADPPSVRDVASFAGETAALARGQSAGAASVWRAAGAELAASASVAIRRCGAREVALTGGLAAAGELVETPLREGLPDDAVLVSAAGGPLEGALRLARASSTPLDAFVDREVLQ